MASKSLSSQMQAKHTEMMRFELQAVALRLFEERGFNEVTVERIAAEANTSMRTFYRYFIAKEDVLQVVIDRRTAALRVALAARPLEEPPLHALRVALEEVVSTEDLELLRRWMNVIAATPTVINGVLGGIQLKTLRVIAVFFGDRLGQPSDSLVPTMLAAAAGGIMQASHTRWFVQGGDLVAAMSEGLGVLESGIGTDPQAWLAAAAAAAPATGP